MCRSLIIFVALSYHLSLFSLPAKIPLPPCITHSEWKTMEKASAGVVSTVKKLEIPNFPKAFNPSILKVDEGYLLSFRYLPDAKRLWYSQLGLVLLDKNFTLISDVVILNTRVKENRTISQSEDARLFTFNGRIFVIYNDSVEVKNPTIQEHRDMFIAEIKKTPTSYALTQAKKLKHAEKYAKVKWQKNWVPFTYENKLLITYSINAHEVVEPNLNTGICERVHETNWVKFPWKWGPARGSTPPLLIDGEYFAFLHSGIELISPVTSGNKCWHYFMGAYTFSKDPPFNLTKISPCPILGPGFYHDSKAPKRVMFPGGCVVEGNKIHVACGKDDCEIWIVTFNKEKLFQTMKPLTGPCRS